MYHTCSCYIYKNQKSSRLTKDDWDYAGNGGDPPVWSHLADQDDILETQGHGEAQGATERAPPLAAHQLSDVDSGLNVKDGKIGLLLVLNPFFNQINMSTDTQIGTYLLKIQARH